MYRDILLILLIILLFLLGIFKQCGVIGITGLFLRFPAVLLLSLLLASLDCPHALFQRFH
jgi:hypothetical protein